MVETHTYNDVMPANVVDRYRMLEVGSAAAILNAVSPEAFKDVIEVLRDFNLTSKMLMTPGGNRGLVPAAIDGAFDTRGWVEARVDTRQVAYLIVRNGKGNINNRLGDPEDIISDSYQKGYLIDNYKDSIAADVEWNPKDGNLDRDLTAYRAWHSLGVIVGAVLITRLHEETRQLAIRIWKDHIIQHPSLANEKQPVRFNTTTTANYEKAVNRVMRGDAGNCPILLVGIGIRSWDGLPL